MDEREVHKRARAHRERVEPWVRPRLVRRAQGAAHAVWDFLFEYYPFSPAKLTTWHPGYGIVLEGPTAHTYLKHPGYRPTTGGVTADIAFLQGRRPRLDLAIRILDGTRSRPPMTGCFALHEWAMVYRQTQHQVRHAQLPLRLPTEEIAATVEAIGLRCTHIDAYRFFTPQAVPLNAGEPTRANQPELEQPGCLHAAMDLYKMTAWFQPLTSSDLLLDCFENAARARELDMRASPYDVSAFGLEPIRVETKHGRREYAKAQAEMMERTDPLRRRLLADLVVLQTEVEAAAASSVIALRQARTSAGVSAPEVEAVTQEAAATF